MPAENGGCSVSEMLDAAAVSLIAWAGPDGGGDPRIGKDGSMAGPGRDWFGRGWMLARSSTWSSQLHLVPFLFSSAQRLCFVAERQRGA